MQALWMGILSFLFAPILTAATVMTVSFDASEMRVVRETLARDLKKHKHVEFLIDKNSDYAQFIGALEKNRPDFVALLDNKAVNFMKRLEEEKKPENLARIQAAATMALNLRNVLQGSTRICGIHYEVPAFTIITRFRSLMQRTITRVLAPYRASEFEWMISEARQQLQKEGIELIGVDVEANGREQEAINKLVETILSDEHAGRKIDAILVPTDNVILNKEAFTAIWLRKARSLKVPFLCNIEKFASKDFDFCTFAAYPDLVALGHQLAEQINEVLENGSSVKDLGVDYIIGVQEALNLSRARALDLPMRSDRIEAVERVE
ncbi:MAG TPA: hypothetical protein VFO10_04690 [Oligoflexus sp.]|uniref:hypothetical protein n=1 Tax=Oligoflexus sp. TaxID=1971216 RepID=UPI002D7F57B5|nr:hypothetical protein [Oligoflexus sp.]HET9236520.1 hypothetical protein [Oligoflexus sp.]